MLHYVIIFTRSVYDVKDEVITKFNNFSLYNIERDTLMIGKLMEKKKYGIRKIHRF